MHSFPSLAFARRAAAVALLLASFPALSDNAPSASAVRVTTIGPTYATFNSFITTGDLPADGYFEISRSLNFSNPVALGRQTFPPTGGAITPLLTMAKGLVPQTLYLGRAVATNATGVVNYSPVFTFQTGPGVAPLAVSVGVPRYGPSFATLFVRESTGYVHSSISVLVSKDPAMSSPLQLEERTFPPLEIVETEYLLDGLLAGQPYYFQAVAKNAYGVTYSTVVAITPH